jgi:hypothetical protein
MPTRLVIKEKPHRIGRRIWPVLLTFFGIAAALPLHAQDMKVLVVPIDADNQALSNDDPIVRLALELTGTAFTERGHSVTYDDWFKKRERLGKRFLHSATDWLREARRLRTKADAMIAIKAYEIKDHLRNGEAVKVELHARIYSLPSGRVTYETSILPRTGSATPFDCDRVCVAAALKPSLETDVAELSDDLLRNLPRNRFGPRNRRQSKNSEFREYQLIFQGFGGDEMQKIADYLKKFTGYRRHKVLERNKCYHVISYLSRVARSTLKSNYRRMLLKLRMRNVRLRFDTLRVEANKLGCPS